MDTTNEVEKDEQRMLELMGLIEHQASKPNARLMISDMCHEYYQPVTGFIRWATTSGKLGIHYGIFVTPNGDHIRVAVYKIMGMVSSVGEDKQYQESTLKSPHAPNSRE